MKCCFKCFKSTKNNICCETETVEVDDLMIPIVLELNKAGIKTFSCCSGHPYHDWTDSTNNVYIMVDGIRKIKRVPVDFKVENMNGNTILRSFINAVGREDLMLKIGLRNYILTSWIREEWLSSMEKHI